MLAYDRTYHRLYKIKDAKNNSRLCGSLYNICYSRKKHFLDITAKYFLSVLCLKWVHLGKVSRQQKGTLLQWSSLVEGDEGLYLLNYQTSYCLFELSLLYCQFINATAYHLGHGAPCLGRSSLHLLLLKSFMLGPICALISLY